MFLLSEQSDTNNRNRGYKNLLSQEWMDNKKQNRDLPLSNLKEERSWHGSGIWPKHPSPARIFLTSASFGYDWQDTSYFEQGGNSEQFLTTQLCSCNPEGLASPSITLPDAQGFTNPLAITSAFQGFHKKCNSCESLKCLLKQWLTWR